MVAAAATDLDRESVRVRPPSAPDQPSPGECNAYEDTATKAKAKESKDEPAVGLCSVDIDSHAKSDQCAKNFDPMQFNLAISSPRYCPVFRSQQSCPSGFL
jgi:hypothetical protein